MAVGVVERNWRVREGGARGSSRGGRGIEEEDVVGRGWRCRWLWRVGFRVGGATGEIGVHEDESVVEGMVRGWCEV